MNPDELDKKLEELYFSAQSASSEGLSEEALRKCEEAIILLETYGDDVERHTFSDFVMLTGDIHWGAGDYTDAFQAYNKVVLNDPERLDARIACGVALFHLCRFAAAQAALEVCSIEDEDDAEVWYYLGLCALRQGRRELAMTHFHTAHELQDNHYFVPVEMSEKEVIEIVERFVTEIPSELQEILENVPIIIEPRPSDEMLYSADPPMDPLILGIFDGTPLPDVGSFDVVTSPTRIVLFLENIWLVAHDRATLEEELWVTLKHEIGHFLGLSEDDLAERGLD